MALCATAIALVLGTLAAMGLRRTRFFPIALPGIVTGLAFKNGFHAILGLEDRAAAADPVARWVRHWEEHGFGHWCVRESGSDRIIGYAGVKRMLMQGRPVLNLVYRFAPDVWGRGFATEAASAVVSTALVEMPEETIVARVRPDNRSSQHVALKVGLHRDATRDCQGEDGLDLVFRSPDTD